jgi:hypothetical protein
MTAFESKIRLQSLGECCSDARAITKFHVSLSAWVIVSIFLVANRRQLVLVSMNPVSGAVKAVDRFRRACKMS